MGDGKGFSVEVQLILVGGNLLNLNVCNVQIQKEKKTFTLTGRSDVRTYHITQFISKTLREPQYSNRIVMVPICFDRNNPDNKKDLQLKLMVKPENHTMIQYFINVFNQLIEENKDLMKGNKTTLKRPYDRLTQFYDPLQNTSLINKRTCEKVEREALLRELEKERLTGVKSPDLALVSQKTIDYLLKPQLQLPPKSMLEASDAFETSTVSRPPSGNRSYVGTERKVESKTARPAVKAESKHPLRSESRPTQSEQRKTHPAPSPTTPKRPEVARRSNNFLNDVMESSGNVSETRPNKRSLRADLPNATTTCAPYSMDASPIATQKYIDLQGEQDPPVIELSSDFSSISEYRNRKLENTGNSCYLNATMQALAACPPLYNYCTRIRRLLNKKFSLNEFGDEPIWPKVSVFRFLVRMLDALGKRKVDLAYSNPKKIVEPVAQLSESYLRKARQAVGKVNRDFDNSDQQDAHEYLVTILGIIDDVMIEVSKRERMLMSGPKLAMSSCSNPASLFQLKVETTYKCQKCDDLTRKVEARSDISLMINEDTNVESLLPDFVKWSALEKHCSKCKHTVASTCERVVVFPPCLVVNLKRYERVASGSYQKKTCAVRMSHKMDASVLGIVDDLETHPELDITNPPEEKKDEVTEEATEEPDASNNDKDGFSPMKLKGGAKLGIDDEVKIIGAKAGDPFKFRWLRDPKQLTEMLRKKNIRFDESTLQNHCSNVVTYPMTDFSPNDLPGEKKSIVGDGNCLFRALSWCLSGDQRHYNSIREAIKNFMEDNREMMEPWCDDYDKAVKKVSQNHEWGSHTELIAFSTCFNINVYTYLPDGWKEFKPLEHACYTPTFSSRRGALYLDNSTEHYEPVLCLEKQLPESTRTRRSLRQRKHDASDEEKHSDNEEDDYMPSKKVKTSTERPRLARSCKMTSGEKNRSATASEFISDPGTVGYSLVSVVCHKGDSPEKGHYVAYTKDPYDGSWLYCSDKYVKRVEEHVVTEEAAEIGYVLFYVKKKTKTHVKKKTQSP